MPKSIARSKTRKAVAKRFKITASGKVISRSSGRRHLAASKNRKRMRHLAQPNVLSEAETKCIKKNLPFG